MKKYTIYLTAFLLFTLKMFGQFSTVTNLNPVTIVSNTGESPQAKVWTFAGKHWCVLANSGGTIIYRLDGTTWTNILVLASGSTAKPDIKVVGNVVHIVVWKGTSSTFYSVEYDSSTGKYKLWTKRPTRDDITLESGVQSIVIDVDATGRMWMASDGTTSINVRWSDAPYSTWSAPIVLANDVTDADQCSVVAMPAIGKIGVFWSNRNTKRFVFKTHDDGTDPTVWSADEAPGAAGALNIGSGFADSQLNLKVSSDGTVYSAIKTNYNTAGNTQVGLLVRRPSGTWDPLYQVTQNEGTRPIVIVNESLNKMKVVYTLPTGITYRESSLSSIAFGSAFTLISGAYDRATSTKATYNPEVVVLASNSTTAVGVLGTDNATTDQTPPSVVSINKQSPATDPTNATTLVYRATFSEAVNGVDATDFALTATGSATGTISSVAPVGTAGATYDVTVNSVTGNGTLRLDLKASGTGITDLAGNAIAGGFTTGQTFTIQQSQPTLTSVTIASSNATTSLAKVGDVITLNFTASTAINTPTVTIATHTVTATAGANNSFTATYTMASTDASGLVPFTIDFTSTGGVAGSQVTTTTNGSSVTFDKTIPSVVSITRQSPTTNPTNATTLVYRVTFSEGVTGVDATDFTLTVLSGAVSGTISAITPVGTAGSVYDVTVSSVSGNGSLRLDVKSTGTGITDTAGNAIATGFTTGDTFTIQQDTPVLTSVTIVSNNAVTSLAKVGNVVTLSFTASTAINPPTVTIATHSVTATAGANNSYTATYTMASTDASGIVPFTINFTSTGGVAGTQVTTTTNSSSVTFDKTAPSVVSIKRQSPSTNPTNATSLVYRVTFSEGVTGVDATDFTLTVTAGSASGTISSIASVGTAGSVYDVTVNSVTGSGSLRLDLKASGTGIADTAGNAISGGFTTGDTFTIQQDTPVLTSVTIVSNNATQSLAKVGNIITLSFNASTSINSPTVTIATHTVTATAGANNSYTATYTMASTDASGVVPFTIDFTSTAGVAGTRVSSTTNGSSVTFDKTAPSVVSITRQSPTTNPTNATTLVYRVTFSEGVAGVDAADFTLTVTSGSVTGTISSVAAVGSGGAVYDVTVTSVTGNGGLRLNLKDTGTGIVDTAGNAINGGFATGDTFTIQQTTVAPAFTTVTYTSTIPLAMATKEKQQSKVWKFANKWWCVVSAVGGTKIFRLDNTTWTEILLLTTKDSKPDIQIVGDVVHLLLYKGQSNNALLYSVQYDPATNKYKLWSSRPTSTPIMMPVGSETSSFTIDGTGRMWLGSAGVSDVFVWYSDAPYSSWSSPITVATGVKDDDICALTTISIQHKIGIFWSNQNTKRFGFKTHNDGASPTSWSADEVPASQSAIDNLPTGMADDHMNIKVATDGTLYVASKTSYNTNGYAKLILLVRRPAGTWDNAYTISTNPEGTQPIVILNEAINTIKVIYATVENGGDIVYRVSSTSNISFGPPILLFGNNGKIYDYVTSTYQNYNPEIVVLVTNLSTTPIQAEGFMGVDGSSSPLALSKTPELGNTITPPSQSELKATLTAYPNPFSNSVTVNYTLFNKGNYELSLYDVRGVKVSVIQQGWANEGVQNTAHVDGVKLASGIYWLRLQTQDGIKTLKLFVQK